MRTHKHMHMYIQHASITAYLTCAAFEMYNATVTCTAEYGNMFFLLIDGFSRIFSIFLLQTQSVCCSLKSSPPPPPLVAGQSSLAYQPREGLEIIGIAVSSPGTSVISCRGGRMSGAASRSVTAVQYTPRSGFGCCSEEGGGKACF